MRRLLRATAIIFVRTNVRHVVLSVRFGRRCIEVVVVGRGELSRSVVVVDAAVLLLDRSGGCTKYNVVSVATPIGT